MNSNHKRSLYDCFLARKRDQNIVCIAGHQLNGGIPINYERNFLRNKPLVMKACQKCQDFNDMRDGENG